MNNKPQNSKTKVAPRWEKKVHILHFTTELFDSAEDFIHYTSRRFLLSLVITVFICYPTFAQQNRWTYVGTDADDTQFFIDRKSVEVKGKNRRVWHKTIYFDASYRIALLEWACNEKKFFVLSDIVYTPNGSFIRKEIGTKWLFVTPESINETLHQVICPSSARNNVRTSTNKMMAEIIVKTANVRAEPDINSSVVRRVKIGEKFILADEESTNGWYQIILPRTNDTAWVHGNTIKLVEIADNPKVKKRKARSGN